jgi:hypothetical protein
MMAPTEAILFLLVYILLPVVAVLETRVELEKVALRAAEAGMALPQPAAQYQLLDKDSLAAQQMPTQAVAVVAQVQLVLQVAQT